MSGLKPSRTICPHCFSPSVSCQAYVNPNNHQVDQYAKDAFLNGQCYNCGRTGELLRVELNQQTIGNKYEEYLRRRKEEPRYALCLIVYTDIRIQEECVKIKLSSCFDEENDTGTFYFCNGLADLKSLCDKGVENFVIRKIYEFDNQ